MSHRQSRDQDLERELHAHLELEAEEQREAGMTPEQARNAARRAFGNVTFTKEEVRRMWSWTRWEILLQDIRYAFRTLRKSPWFAATAILTLALGIAASTTVLTVVDSVILRPLAYPESGRLVAAWERVRFLGGGPTGPNPLHADIWRQRASTLSGLTLLRHRAYGVAPGADTPRLAGTVLCLPTLFDVLRVRPFLGRGFVADDAVKGRDNVVILTYDLWQSLFQGDRGAIGQTIRVDGNPVEVIGVLPASFHFPNANALRALRSGQPTSGVPEPAVFLPAVFDFNEPMWNSNYGNWTALARLNPRVTIREAEAELNAIQAQIVQDPRNRGDRRPGALLASVQPMQEVVVGDSGTRLWLLMAAVLGLMLIACLNLAHAHLARALGRRREAAVRTALGAAKVRLFWNALAENLLLAAIGGTAGVLLAYAALHVFRSYPPVDLPRLAEVRLNLTVLLFSILLTFAASLLSGILPALRLLSMDPQASLRQSNSRMAGSRQSHRLRTCLIGLQVFGVTALLLVTGLFVKSLLYLVNQDKGFATSHVVVGHAGLPPRTYATDQSRIAFIDAVLENLRSTAGVQTAGVVSKMPLEGESWIEFVARVDRPNQEGPMINLRWVSPGYFETTQQKLVAGRLFEERDRNLDNTILSEGEAKALWGNDDPIGGQVRVRGKARTVIGVVADSLNTSLKSPAPKMAYLHYRDQPPNSIFFMARSAAGTDAAVSLMRDAIRKAAPDAVIGRVKPLDAQLRESLAAERFQTFVLVAFAVSALLLAMLGIYGVLNSSVLTRRQEIGVRMALGATRRKIYALTFAEAGVPVLAGLATGLVASILAGGVIQKLLYGTQAVDAGVILTVIGLFLTSAAVAAFLPAHRAASVDPMDALRSE